MHVRSRSIRETVIQRSGADLLAEASGATVAPMTRGCQPKKLETVNINVRFPPDVHGEMVKLATEDGRSLNNEVIAVLREFIARRRKR